MPRRGDGTDELPSGRWRARYTDPDGKTHTSTHDSHADAIAWREEQRTALRKGVHVAPAAGRLTFGDFAQEWQAGQAGAPATRAKVASLLRRHLLPAFGDRPLSAVRPTEVRRWVVSLTDERRLSPATVHLVYGYASTIFRAAVEDRLLVESPCRNVALPEIVRPRVVPLSVEQVAGLVDAMPERYRALVVLVAGTGLRQGEALGLTLPHVDFLRRSLRVEQQLQAEDGLRLTSRLKTKTSRRAVPLPDVVLHALSAHVEAFPVTHADGLLFTTSYGNGIRATGFREDVWHPAARRAGLPAGTGFHALRHFYASLLIRHGESVKVVQERLGHKSAQETLDTYSHLWPDSEDRTRAAVDAYLGAIPSRVPSRDPAAGGAAGL